MQEKAGQVHGIKGWRDFAARLCAKGYFDGFTLNGSVPLEALVGFYGLNVPSAEPGLSLADYVARRCCGKVWTGFRVPVKGAEFVVREVANGRITKVGVRFPPRAFARERTAAPVRGLRVYRPLETSKAIIPQQT